MIILKKTYDMHNTGDYFEADKKNSLIWLL